MSVELEEYEERVIVFIDILGFREHIKETMNDPNYFIRLRDTLNFISELKTINDKGEKRIGKEITVFSDSIVISYPAQYPGTVFWLLLDVVHIQLEMMRKGILIRGGLTVGKLCHNDNIVYGPAMVAAYELESKTAIYPRVVVNEEVFTTAVMYPYNPPEMELEYVQDLCEQDWDDQWYVDFLRQDQEFEYQYDYLKALRIIKEVILKELKQNKPKPNVRMKYQWLKNYFNEVVEEFQFEHDLYIDEDKEE